MERTKRTLFTIYTDLLKTACDELNDKEFGELMRALVNYDITGEDKPPKDRTVKMLYGVGKKQLEELYQNYLAKCTKLSQNAKARWEKLSIDEKIEAVKSLEKSKKKKG